MSVAVFKNVFNKDRAALAPEQRRHQHGLGVGRKTRVRRSTHGAHGAQRSGRAQGNGVRLAPHLAAALGERERHGGHRAVVHAGEPDLTARRRRGAEVGRADDAVPDDAVRAAVQHRAALDRDDGAARAVHPCAHAPQQRLKIDDLRLAGRVVDDACALRAAGGENGVLRRADARNGEGDVRAAKAFRLAAQLAVALGDLRAQLAQGGQMQVNGPRTELAAAGVGQDRFSLPREDRAQKNDGRAHFAHQLVGNVAARHRRSVHLQRRAVAPHAAAEVAQDGDGRVHVAQTRTVLDAADVPREDRRRQHGQDAVLAALYRQFSVKRRAALDAQIAHVPFLPFPMGQQTKP